MKNVRIGVLSLLSLAVLLVGASSVSAHGGSKAQKQKKGHKPSKVEICHNTGSGKVILIEVSENAVAKHIENHGDALLSVFYADADGDGYGDAAESLEACFAPDGYVDNSDDCDDSDATAALVCTAECTCIASFEHALGTWNDERSPVELEFDEGTGSCLDQRVEGSDYLLLESDRFFTIFGEELRGCGLELFLYGSSPEPGSAEVLDEAGRQACRDYLFELCGP